MSPDVLNFENRSRDPNDPEISNSQIFEISEAETHNPENLNVRIQNIKILQFFKVSLLRISTLNMSGFISCGF